MVENSLGLDPKSQIEANNKSNTFDKRYDSFFNSTTKTLEDILLAEWESSENEKTISNAIEHIAYDVDFFRKSFTEFQGVFKSQTSEITTPLLLGYEKSASAIESAIISASDMRDVQVFSGAENMQTNEHVNSSGVLASNITDSFFMIETTLDMIESNTRLLLNHFTSADKKKSGTTGKNSLDDTPDSSSIFGTIIGVFSTIMGAIGEYLGLDALIVSVKKMASDFGPKILTKIVGFFKGIGEFISEAFASLITKFPIIGEIFAPIGNLFKPILKIFGSGGAKVIPVIGEVIMAVMAIWDFFEGFSDKGASELLGKDKESLTLWDKVTSGIVSVISGFLFGFVDKKTILPYVQKFTNTIKELWDGFTTMVPDKIKNFISKAVDGALSFGKKIVDWFSALPDTIWDLFLKYVSFGTIDKNGMTDFGKIVNDKIIGIVESILGFLKNMIIDFFGEKVAAYLGVKKDTTTLQASTNLSAPVVGSSSVSVIPKTLDTSTSKITQDLAVKKVEASNAQPQNTTNNVQSGSNAPQYSVDRTVSSGRDESNRVIGGRAQFGFSF